MISGLRPYPEMKDSGVEWLGRVPAHWSVVPGRACFRMKKEPNSDLRENTVLSLSFGRIVVKAPETLHGLVPSSFETYQIVAPSDIIVRPTDLQNDQHSLRFGLSTSRGIITSAYLRFSTLQGALPKYGHLLLHTYDLMKVFYGLGSGLRQNLDWSDFKHLPCVLPPVSEQSAVVRFIDQADRRIQRYIHAKEKLIALLEEQRKTIIDQAIMGQFDVQTGKPYPSYRDTIIQWLPEIPSRWEVLRFGNRIDLAVGFPFKSEGFSESEEDVRLLRGVNVSPGGLRWEETVRWPASDVGAFSDYQLEVGDIVLGMDRPIIGTGVRVAVVGETDVPSLLLQRVARIRPDETKLDPDFAYLLLRGNSFLNYLAPIFTGISVPHLSPGQIRNFSIALPSVNEQREISRYLQSSTRKTQAAVEAAQRQVALVRDFRARLVADVVTGKTDVREAASMLPDIGTGVEESGNGGPLAEWVGDLDEVGLAIANSAA